MEGAWPLSDRWLWGLTGTVTSQKDSLESPSPLSSTHTPEGPPPAPPPPRAPAYWAVWSSVSCRQVSPGGRGTSGVPALKLSAVTAASVLLLHRGGPCWCHSGPQIPGRKVRTESDTEMHSGSEPRLYVLVPTRPGNAG